MIPTEDNYVHWVLSGIKEYFRRIDYRVLDFSIGQIKERDCPVDRMLAVGNKIIGLQFKRPLSEKAPWHFKLTPHQHRMITQAQWIFYCVPDFADLKLQEVALHHCKFVPGIDPNRKAITNEDRYYRWGSFAGKIIECTVGLRMDSQDRIEQVFSDMVDNPRDTYLLLNKMHEELYIIRDTAQFVGFEDEIS